MQSKKEFHETKNGIIKVEVFEPKEDSFRGFKGVWICRDIWLDKNLTWTEKIMLVEIDSLDNDLGCYASNNYFAKFFDLSAGRISQIITSLIKKDYITAEYEREGKQVIKRILKLKKAMPEKGYLENDYKVVNKLNRVVNKLNGGYLENDKENNILINNIINNKDNIYIDDVNYIYSLYPSKCPISTRSTGKTSKDKDVIKKLLSKSNKDQLEEIINLYVKDCTKNKTYIKNFRTLLNNLPDKDEYKEVCMDYTINEF